MKLKLISFAIKATLFLLPILLSVTAFNKIQSLKEDNERLINNQNALISQNVIIMAESQKYKVSDSLNAARVSQLRLTLSEYEQHRSEDMKLIKQLKTEKSDLQKVVSSQLATINSLQAKLENLVVTDSITMQIDTLKCFHTHTEWTDVTGCINTRTDSVNIHLKNRESLKIVESVTYKRFWGFLWKTNKVKNRYVDVVSENPNTEIISVECISIEP